MLLCSSLFFLQPIPFNALNLMPNKFEKEKRERNSNKRCFTRFDIAKETLSAFWKSRYSTRIEREREIRGEFGVARVMAGKEGRKDGKGRKGGGARGARGGGRPLTHDSNDTRTYKSRRAPRSARSSPYITMSYGCKPFKHRITRFTYCL